MGSLSKGGLIVKTTFMLDPHFMIEISHVEDDNITKWNNACIKSFKFDLLKFHYTLSHIHIKQLIIKQYFVLTFSLQSRTIKWPRESYSTEDENPLMDIFINTTE